MPRLTHSKTKQCLLAGLNKSGLLLVFFLLSQLLFSSSGYCAEQIGIFYPDISSPYKEIFESIIEGITENHNQNYEYHSYPLKRDYSPEELQQSLNNDQVRAIIALGKRGYIAASNFSDELPIIYGALPLIPNGISGISLSADPAELFKRLKTLDPSVRQIHVVYSPKLSGWLMPLAQQAAETLGLQLSSHSADDLRSAMHQYRKLLQNIRGRRNAIWLPLDSITANDDVVLPMLLQEAWNKDLVLFSNKPIHAQRGALFSMYPDNQAMGKALFELLDSWLAEGKEPGVLPLRQLNLAVNLRTAAHLDLNFDQSQQRDFNLSFPAR